MYFYANSFTLIFDCIHCPQTSSEIQLDVIVAPGLHWPVKTHESTKQKHLATKKKKMEYKPFPFFALKGRAKKLSYFRTKS